MTVLSPETLPRHELVGLPVRVVESTDPTRVGLAGRVVGETMRTLCIRTPTGEKQVPKGTATFEFALTDEAAADREAAGTASEPSESELAGAGDDGGEDAAHVTVDGAVLLSRPARRTENGVDSTWH
ncbi:MAG: ribonuclease P protein component 1 [Halobacteriaceae archaeon]